MEKDQLQPKAELEQIADRNKTYLETVRQLIKTLETQVSLERKKRLLDAKIAEATRKNKSLERKTRLRDAKIAEATRKNKRKRKSK